MDEVDNPGDYVKIAVLTDPQVLLPKLSYSFPICKYNISSVELLEIILISLFMIDCMLNF